MIERRTGDIKRANKTREAQEEPVAQHAEKHKGPNAAHRSFPSSQSAHRPRPTGDNSWGLSLFRLHFCTSDIDSQHRLDDLSWMTQPPSLYHVLNPRLCTCSTSLCQLFTDCPWCWGPKPPFAYFPEPRGPVRGWTPHAALPTFLCKQVSLSLCRTYTLALPVAANSTECLKTPGTSRIWLFCMQRWGGEVWRQTK